MSQLLYSFFFLFVCFLGVAWGAVLGALQTSANFRYFPSDNSAERIFYFLFFLIAGEILGDEAACLQLLTLAAAAAAFLQDLLTAAMAGSLSLQLACSSRSWQRRGALTCRGLGACL